MKINYTVPKIIAEIGCNHKGDYQLAEELIKSAKECGATYAKFQKRNSTELLTAEQYSAPHPNPNNSYGETYGEHREFLEFDLDQHRKLKKYAESIGIGYSTSVWDNSSASEITQLNPDLIKVPSACNNNFEMLEILRDNYNGEVHISFGMTTQEEEGKIINFFKSKNESKDRLVVYSCTSGYPVKFEDVCLLEISRIKEQFQNDVKAVGFSGHHLGIAIDNAAYALGAMWIERHFTMDRTWKGTDHAASLEPNGLKKLCRDVVATYKALNFKGEEILEVEKVQREKLKYRKH
jgi:sialic acid synthase